MPVILPPTAPDRSFPRRRFLANASRGTLGALLAGGLTGRFIGGALRAEDGPTAAPTKPGVWALFSDPHIDASLTAENQGFHMASNLLRCSGQALRERPTAAIVNGDLARSDGRPEDYRSFLELMGPLRASGLSVHLTLGNHDDRKSFLSVLGDDGAKLTRIDRAPVSEKYCETRVIDGVRWMLLDSLDAVNKTPGVLGPRQIEWVTSELDRDATKPAVIFVHHNVEVSEIGLTDREPLMAVLRPRSQVKAVFFGHTHRWRRFVDDGIHMVNLPAVGYTFQKEEPVGWVLAKPSETGLEIQLRSLEPHADHGKPIFLPWRASKAAPVVF